MSDFLFEPMPSKEVVEFLRHKPVVLRAVFNRLAPEIKGRAFTVTGLEDARAMAEIRDLIAEMAEGRHWVDARRDIADELSERIPFVENPDADADTRREQRAAAEARAELLLRVNGFQAFAAAADRVLTEQADVFPFSQFVAMEDARTCEICGPLNGIILPTLDLWWELHTPPSQHPGCRCRKVGMSRDDMQEAREADAELPPESRDILSDRQIERLHNEGTIFRSMPELNYPGAEHYDPDKPIGWKNYRYLTPAQNYDVRAAVECATTREEKLKAYQWTPGSLRLNPDQLAARYDDHPEIWRMFVGQMKRDQLEDGRTVWEWLTGKEAAAKTPDGGRQQARRTEQLPLPMPGMKNVQAEEIRFESLDQAKAWWSARGVEATEHAAGIGAAMSQRKTLAHAEKLAKEFTRLKTQWPGMGGPKVLYLKNAKRGHALLDGPRPSMVVRADEWDLAAFEVAKQIEQETGNKELSYQPGNTVRDCFRHELAHTLSTPEVMREWQPVYEKLGEAWFKKHVSRYAASKMSEGLAECFTVATRMDYIRGTLPEEIERVIFKWILREA